MVVSREQRHAPKALAGPRRTEAGGFRRAGRGQGQTPSLGPPQLSGPLETRKEARGFFLSISVVLRVWQGEGGHRETKGSSSAASEDHSGPLRGQYCHPGR